MRQSRHVAWEKQKRFGKSLVLLAAIILLAMGAVGASLAFLVDKTGAKTNVFQPSRVSCAVRENFQNNVKTDVKIKNSGDTDAYIRAAIIVTWQAANGNIYGKAPAAGTDYALNQNLTGQGWFQNSDGYYYYKHAVAPGNETGVLIASCSPVAGKAPAGYTLRVEILAEAIQSSPAAAAAGSWDVTVHAGGTISKD